MQLVNDGGLTDSRIARDQDELRRTLNDSLEGGEQGRDLALAPVQFLRDEQPVRCVVFAQGKVADAPPGLPLSQATPKVTLQTCRGLVTLLGRFREQLHNDGRN